jgi:peptidoglycan/xylan/chitin deacetylase (PgdA/CDA1 family)
MLDGSLVTADALRRQLRLLKSQYAVISPDRLLEWLQTGRPLPIRAVLLTCDDGLRNTLTDMLPLLQEERLSCLFFVTGASVGETPEMLWYEQLYLLLQKAPPGPMEIADPDWCDELEQDGNRHTLWWSLVKRLSQRDQQGRSRFMQETRRRLGLQEDWITEHTQESAKARRFLLLTSNELLQLAAQGMTIGAHTLSHPFLSQASTESVKREIAESRSVFENVLGRKIWAFAYPFGSPGSLGIREVKLAKAAGYAAAFVNVGGGFGADLPPFALPRVHVTADMTLGEFDAHVSGFYRAFRKPPTIFAARSRGVMRKEGTHQIADDES